MESEAPLIDRRVKRKTRSNLNATPFAESLPAQDPRGRNSAKRMWVPGHFVTSDFQEEAVNHGLPPTSYPSAPDYSEERHLRRKRQKAYETSTFRRSNSGVKPNAVHVLKGGEVDPTCEGKNAWDRALRSFVPKIIDMSVVEWSQHRPQTLQKLRDALDSEFEYDGHPLSQEGFRNSVTRFLKAERARLKVLYFKGQKKPPVHVFDDQWSRLIEYWNTDAQKKKSSKMAAARQGVKSYGLQGRRGKSAKDAHVVGALNYIFHCCFFCFP